MSDSSFKITDADRRLVNGEGLTAEIGVDASEIEWRKDFTNFTHDDAQRLASVSHLFEASVLV